MADDAKQWVQRANRKTRRKNARLTHLGDVPFGPELTLRRFVMGNGLQVRLLIDDSAPVVAFHTWYRVGSKHEKPGKTGLAHLFEHLMFKETKTYGAGQFDKRLERVGADTNASTWTDWTQYHENVPKKALELAVTLESDRMVNLVLNDAQVASEKEVVANERRMRVDDDVEGTASEVLYKNAFSKHPYGWPTIGWMKDIEGFTTRDCLDFYSTYYAPNNATLVAVGDVNGPEFLSLLQDRYGGHKPAKLPKERRIVEPPQRREKRIRLVQPTPTEKLLFGFRGPAFGDYDYAALTVAHEVLLGGRSSRLFNRLVVEKELASDLSGFISPFTDPGLYEMWVNARENGTAKTIEKIVWSEFAKLGQKGATDAELEKAKNRLELGFLGAMETAAGKAEQVGFYDTVLGDATRVFRRLEEYRRVTSDDVKKAATRALAKSRCTLVHVVPGKA